MARNGGKTVIYESQILRLTLYCSDPSSIAAIYAAATWHGIDKLSGHLQTIV